MPKATLTPVRVHKGRTNILTVDLGYDVSGDTLTSEIRVSANQTSPIIATWAVSFATTGVDGRLILRLDNSATVNIEHANGYMDIKRLTGGEPVPVFAQPIPVTFVDSVTV